MKENCCGKCAGMTQLRASSGIHNGQCWNCKCECHSPQKPQPSEAGRDEWEKEFDNWKIEDLHYARQEVKQFIRDLIKKERAEAKEIGYELRDKEYAETLKGVEEIPTTCRQGIVA